MPRNARSAGAFLSDSQTRPSACPDRFDFQTARSAFSQRSATRILCRGAGFACLSLPSKQEVRGSRSPPSRGQAPAKCEGDGAPSGAAWSLVHVPFPTRGAFRRAIAASSYGAGPRFRRSLLGSPPSASSSQGPLVTPGGAPAPPERGRSVHLPPAGAAFCSIIVTPRDDAPR